MKTKGKKSVVVQYEKMRPKELKAATAAFDLEFVVQATFGLIAGFIGMLVLESAMG